MAANPQHGPRPPSGPKSPPLAARLAAGQGAPDQSRQLTREHSAEERDAGRMREPDDHKKISNKIKQLGQAWKPGVISTPFLFRVSLCVACDDQRFEGLRLSMLSEEQIDLLVFVLGQLPPDMPMSKFNSTLKGEIRILFRQTHRNLLRNNPNRLQGLSTEYDILAIIAMRLGNTPSCLSDELRGMCEAMRQRAPSIVLEPPVHSSAGQGGDHSIASPAKPTSSKRTPLMMLGCGGKDESPSAKKQKTEKTELATDPEATAEAEAIVNAALDALTAQRHKKQNKEKKDKKEKEKKHKQNKKDKSEKEDTHKEAGPADVASAGNTSADAVVGADASAPSTAAASPSAGAAAVVAPAAAGAPVVAWNIPALDMSAFGKKKDRPAAATGATASKDVEKEAESESALSSESS